MEYVEFPGLDPLWSEVWLFSNFNCIRRRPSSQLKYCRQFTRLWEWQRKDSGLTVDGGDQDNSGDRTAL